ncbi:hypothetical protein ACLMAL_11650 [Nocardia sp. CWNU-33]|uniref:hypothetical protein n=1 Tax=Nocardia sp. CWNU-33 TaxID=3392117 RepID=UPI00398F341C
METPTTGQSPAGKRGTHNRRRCAGGARSWVDKATGNRRGSIANPPGFDVFLRLTSVRFTLIFWQTPYEGSVFTREQK